MKKGIFTLVNSEELLPGYHRLTLAGDTGPLRPGQFAEVSVPGYFLRRPFSVADKRRGLAEHRRARGRCGHRGAQRPRPRRGAGCALRPGQRLRPQFRRRPRAARGRRGAASPRSTRPAASSSLRRGGARRAGLQTRPRRPSTPKNSPRWARMWSPTPPTARWESGLRHRRARGGRIYARARCGPLPMLRRVDELALSPAQFSLEARMGCGFGACMGCTVETVRGARRVCKDGPVFLRSGDARLGLRRRGLSKEGRIWTPESRSAGSS